ncbi:MAG: 3-oxoacyl-[acyl-carrier-protein] synthase III C-terminal domain-containing protein [Thermodesulfobacteriota bacterium]
MANHDEDAITMAVAAARNCLSGQATPAVGGLFLATTTAPYLEKLNSSLVAAATNLGIDLMTMDCANSLRGVVTALRAALATVDSGAAPNILVAAADCRMGYPKSDQEQMFGDGAAAVLVDSQDLVAAYRGGCSVSSEMMDVWRREEDEFVHTWEGRFITQKGYVEHMQRAVSGLLTQQGLEANAIAKFVLTAPDPRALKALTSSLGLPADKLEDHLLAQVGDCGAAHPLILLVAALEKASPGDLILLAAHGDGAEAMLFEATERAGAPQAGTSVADYLAHKIPFHSYGKFLSYKGVFEAVPGEPFRLMPSASVTWRDRDSIFRCHGSRCTDCGVVAFPVQRICPSCGSKDAFQHQPLGHLQGEVFTFTLDNLAGRSDDPVVVQTVAELGQDKIRFYGLMTDCIPAQVTVGMPVELTFRRFYDGAGMHNYFWKLKPVMGLLERQK